MTPPNEYWLTNDMVFRNKSPITTIGRIMTVITHHPIIIQLKGIFICLLAINEDLASLNLKLIAFINLDRTFVNSNILHVESDSSTLLRNPYRTIVVACPTSISIKRIKVANNSFCIQVDSLYNILTCCKSLISLLCQRHNARLVEGT